MVGSVAASALVMAGVFGILMLFAGGESGAAPGVSVEVPSRAEDAGRAVAWVGAGLSTPAPLPVEEPLPPAPDPALVEASTAGLLPKIDAAGRLPRQVYARPFNRGDDRARVVVIVGGIGLARRPSEAAINGLPGAVTLAIGADAPHPDDWVRAARWRGHEVLATVPLAEEPGATDDPGPRALRAAEPASELTQQLAGLLGGLTGYVGVLATGGSAFARDPEELKPALAMLLERGLVLVSSGSGPLLRAASQSELARVRIDVVIDEAVDAAAVESQLQALLGIAKERFSAVGLARPNAMTLNVLRALIASLDQSRYVLAPVSTLAERKGSP